MARFRDAAQTLELSGCFGIINPELKDVKLNEVMQWTSRDVKGAKDGDIAQSNTTYIEVIKAVIVLEGPEPKSYYGLWYDLRNNILKVHATFLKTVLKDFDMIKK